MEKAETSMGKGVMYVQDAVMSLVVLSTAR